MWSISCGKRHLLLSTFLLQILRLHTYNKMFQLITSLYTQAKLNASHKHIRKLYFTYLGHPFSSPGAIAVVSLYIFGLSCNLFFLRQTVQNISFLSIQNDRESNFLLQVAHFMHFLWYFTPPIEMNISINLYEFANMLKPR